jgi:hypothetical protein
MVLSFAGFGSVWLRWLAGFQDGFVWQNSSLQARSETSTVSGAGTAAFNLRDDFLVLAG